MAYQWIYGNVLSGLTFPLITASGTLAKGYDPGQLSAVITKDGGAWGAMLSGRLSGIPGDGIYCFASISSTEMGCYSWIIKVSAASGCLDQVIMGYNLSGYPRYSDLSGFAHSIDCSGSDKILTAVSGIPLAVGSGWVGCSGNNALMVAVSAIPLAVASGWNWTACSGSDKILSAVSGLKNDVSGLPGILVAVSAPCIIASAYHSGATIMAVANAMSGNAGTATVDISSIAAQVWNSLKATYTSTATFADLQNGATPNVNVSAIAAQTWNSLQATYTSSTTFGGNFSGLAHSLDCSGNNNLLNAISGIPLAVGSGWVGCSGINFVMVAVSNIVVNTASGFAPIMTAASGIPLAVASGWNWTACSGNDKLLTAISGVAGAVGSGFSPIMTAVSAVPLAVASGWNWNACSGNDKILTAVSGVVNACASGFIGVSGLSHTADISGFAALSGFAHSVDTSGNNNLLSAISGLRNDVSGLPGIMTQVSGISVLATVSGLTQILAAVSGLGVNMLNISGLSNILAAVSTCPSGVLIASIQDSDSLTSGTVGHTLRLLRWFSWENLYIDKTFNPARLYLKTDTVNYSSWWSVTDNASQTTRVRGG